MATATATTDAMLPTDRLVTRKDICRIFSVHNDVITDWIGTGVLPRPIAPGGKTHYWRPADIQAVIDEMAGDE